MYLISPHQTWLGAGTSNSRFKISGRSTVACLQACDPGCLLTNNQFPHQATHLKLSDLLAIFLHHRHDAAAAGGASTLREQLINSAAYGYGGLMVKMARFFRRPGFAQLYMLTFNADDHELMSNYRRPEDQKRMVVILSRGLYRDRLAAPVEASSEFMRKYPSGRLMVG